MGSLAAIGIVKGKPFAPDARMRGILTDAVKTANATARALVFNPRDSEGFYYYPGSAWQNSLWVGGYEFETPPPQLSPDGFSKPYPPTGARTLELAHGVVLLRNRYHAGDDHALARHRLAIRVGIHGRG